MGEVARLFYESAHPFQRVCLQAPNLLITGTIYFADEHYTILIEKNNILLKDKIRTARHVIDAKERCLENVLTVFLELPNRADYVLSDEIRSNNVPNYRTHSEVN